MSRHHPKKRPPFITLPRHRRSDEVIRLKGEIRRDADLYGGRFTSHHVLNEPGRPDLYNQWVDFYFVGSNRFTIWNAEIVTARRAFWDAANSLAYNRADALVTPEKPRQPIWRPDRCRTLLASVTWGTKASTRRYKLFRATIRALTATPTSLSISLEKRHDAATRLRACHARQSHRVAKSDDRRDGAFRERESRHPRTSADGGAWGAAHPVFGGPGWPR